MPNTVQRHTVTPSSINARLSVHAQPLHHITRPRNAAAHSSGLYRVKYWLASLSPQTQALAARARNTQAINKANCRVFKSNLYLTLSA